MDILCFHICVNHYFSLENTFQFKIGKHKPQYGITNNTVKLLNTSLKLLKVH